MHVPAGYVEPISTPQHGESDDASTGAGTDENTSDDAVAMEVVTITLAGPRRYLAICDNHASDEDEMDFEKGDVSAAKEIDF